MKQSSILTQNKKINETDFITTILADIKDIVDTMNQLYKDNKDSILDISYESRYNILTIITKIFLQNYLNTHTNLIVT